MLLGLALLGCREAAGPRPPESSYGYILLTFQGQTLRFSRGFDSLVAYYSPEAQTLSLTGSTVPGSAPPDNLLLLLDSLPPLTTNSSRQHSPTYFGVTFYETPGSDSSLVYPFRAVGLATDRVTLSHIDFTRCEVKGTFHATLYYAGDPPGYPVDGTFWGRMLWNSTTPGLCLR